MPRVIGLIFLLLVASWVMLAATFQGAAWLLLWPAAAFGLAGLGYLGLGARVFGKRLDGSLSWPAVILMAPYLAFGWLSWRAVKLGSEPNHDQILPWLYLGRRPAPGELPADVTLVVDLTAEFPVDRALLGERFYLCLPTLDGHVPSPDALDALVQQADARGGVMYIHCAYGHGRSALVAAALLLRRGVVGGVDEALAMLKAARPRVRLSLSQREALRRYAAALPKAA